MTIFTVVKTSLSTGDSEVVRAYVSDVSAMLSCAELTSQATSTETFEVQEVELITKNN